MAVTERVGEGDSGGAAGVSPLTAARPGQGRVFISYSRKDKAFVQRLHEALKAKGLGTWVDWEGIPLSADWLREIYGGIEAADTVVFVISPDSAASTVCQQELAHAVANHKRLIPVVFRDVAASAVPPALASLNWIFFRETDDFETAFAALIGAIETDLDWVRAHTRLLVRAIEWEQKGRNDSLLVRGADLREAEDWLARAGDQKGAQPTTLQTRYLLAARRAETRRQRLILASLVAFVVLVGVAGVVAVFQRNEAVAQRQAADVAREQETVQRREAERQRAEAERQRSEAERQQAEAERQRDTAQARELAANSVSQLDADPELSLLLASASLKRSPTDQGDVALQRALVASRVRRVLRGHTESVLRVAFSPDGTRAATVSADGTARIWDAATGASIATMTVPSTAGASKSERALDDLAFSPDGRWLAATGNKQPSVRVWSTATGEQVADLVSPERSEGVGGPTFSPDGAWLLITRGNRPPVLWPTATWTQARSLDTPQGQRTGFTTLAVFSRDGRLVAGNSGNDIVVWNATTGSVLGVLKGHEDIITALAFSADGGRLLSASWDGTARIWALSGNRDVILRGHSRKVLGAVFDSTGTLVATAGDDRTARIWDVRNGQQTALLAGHLGPVDAVSFSPDGQLVLTASHDKTARIWTVAGLPVAVLSGHTDVVPSAAFSPDGRQVLTASYDGTARLWDGSMSRPLAAARVGRQLDLAVSPDGRLLATGAADGLARLLDTATGKEVSALRGHTGTVNRAEFSSDGKLVLTVGDDGTARVWDVAGARQLVELRPTGTAVSLGATHFSADGERVLTSGTNSVITVWEWRARRPVVSLTVPVPRDRSAAFAGAPDARFSPDGRLLAAAGEDNHLYVWDLSSKALVADLPTNGFGLGRLRFSPDGRALLARVGEDTVQLWSTETWQPTRSMTSPSGGAVSAASFSPDSRLVLTGSQSASDADNLARVWDAATGKVVAELRGHSSGINDAAFSPDGKWVVTASIDGTARVWEAATGRSAMELSGPGGMMTRAVFGPDNQLIAALGGPDGSALLYRCTVCGSRDELLALAAVNVTRDLTPEERARYVP